MEEHLSSQKSLQFSSGLKFMLPQLVKAGDSFINLFSRSHDKLSGHRNFGVLEFSGETTTGERSTLSRPEPGLQA